MGGRVTLRRAGFASGAEPHAHGGVCGPPSVRLFISPKGVWLVTLGRPWPTFFSESYGNLGQEPGPN